MVINKEESGDWDIVDNLDQNSEIWPRSDLAVTGGWNSCLFRKKCLLSALIISSLSASYFKVAYHLPFFFSETDRTLISLWGWHYYSQMWEAAALWRRILASWKQSHVWAPVAWLWLLITDGSAISGSSSPAGSHSLIVWHPFAPAASGAQLTVS